MNSIFERHIETPNTDEMVAASSQFGARAVNAVDTLKKALATHMKDKSEILATIRGPLLRLLPERHENYRGHISEALTELFKISAELPKQLREADTPERLSCVLESIEQVMVAEYELLAALRLSASAIAVNHPQAGQEILIDISTMSVSALLVESKVASARRNLGSVSDD